MAASTLVPILKVDITVLAMPDTDSWMTTKDVKVRYILNEESLA